VGADAFVRPAEAKPSVQTTEPATRTAESIAEKRRLKTA